jgi:hypothetical protein
MRMARIKVKDSIKVAPINPLHVVDFYKDDDGDIILRTTKEDDGWTLNMPLDEALEELDAAMRDEDICLGSDPSRGLYGASTVVEITAK